MAPSQMEYCNTAQSGYAHKKFNCGYTHKKFGSRIINRNPVGEDGACKEKLQLTTNNKQSKDIFRPYALNDVATPRKRKAAEHLQNGAPAKRHMVANGTITDMPINESSRQTEQANFNQTATMTSTPTSQQQHIQYQHLLQQLQHHNQQLQPQQPFAINKQAFALMLQKQRAALYMRNLMKFNGNGNGWPTLLNSSLIVSNRC